MIPLTRKLIVALLVVVVCSSLLMAQVPASPASGLTAQTDTGTRAYIPYDGVTENVNLTNGNVNIKIPLVHLPGRNGLDLDIHLEYDSAIWKFEGGYDAESGIAGGGWFEDQRFPYVAMGWHFNVPTVSFSEATLYDYDMQLIMCTGTTTVIMPDGARYLFNNNPLCGPQIALNVMDTEDNSGAQFVLSTRMLALANGTKVYFGSQTGCMGENCAMATALVDANGNRITYTSDGAILQSITDSVGRIVTFTFNPTTGQYNQINYTDPVAPNSQATVSFAYSPVTLNWLFYQPIADYKATPPVYVTHQIGNYAISMLESVSVGDHQFSFRYDPYTDPYRNGQNFGELSQITYPTGGYTQYTYQNTTTLAYATDNGGVVALDADLHQLYQKTSCSQASDCATTTYNPSTLTTNPHMDVVYPDGHTDSHFFTVALVPGYGDESFHGDAAREYQVITYSAGVPTKTVTTTYHPPLEAGAIKSWALPSEIQTTVNGLTKTEHFDYQPLTVTYLPWPPELGPYQMAPITRPIDFNVIQHKEYDWGSTTVLRQTDNEWVSTPDYFSPNSRLLRLKSLSTISDASTALEQTSYEYDNYGVSGLSPSGATQHDTSIANYRGNLTSFKRCQTLSAAGSCTTWLLPPTQYQYDDAGNITAIIDPRGITSYFSYADSWADSTCTPANQNPPLPGIAAAYLTHVTDGAGLPTAVTYNSCRGTIASMTDANNAITTYGYDQYARRTRITFPPEPSGQGQITVTYSEPPANPYSIETRESLATTTEVVNTTYLDGFGRVCRTALNSDPEGTAVVDTSDDNMGRKWVVTNPYRLTSGVGVCPAYTEANLPAVPYTKYSYDVLNRVLDVRNADNTHITTGYTAENATQCTTVTDEATKQRKSCVDGIDRLRKVFEDPAQLNYETDYQYDARGNLIQVDQKGGSANSGDWHTRHFYYDGLSRLTQASNPESGSIGYTYDASGNMASKTDQRGTVISYCYDADNRLTQKKYDNQPRFSACPNMPAPDATYRFDESNASYGRGRRTSMTDASGSTSWSYDARGRAIAEQRTIAGITKLTNHLYNLNGSIKTITYPHDEQNTQPYSIDYTYSPAGRLLSVVHNDPDPNKVEQFASGALYAPHGALRKVVYGSGSTQIIAQFTFNERLQPLQMSHTTGNELDQGQLSLATCPTTRGNLQHLLYSFNVGVANNGNVSGIADCLDSTWSTTYTYDTLNRLQYGAAGTRWNQTFGFDPWGNLLSAQGTNQFTRGVDSNNRFTPDTAQYDAAGSMTAYYDGISWRYYRYDAENRLIDFRAGQQNDDAYTYDGDGKRVRKIGKLYWTGTGPDPLVETDENDVVLHYYIYFDGKRIARKDFSDQ